MQIKYNTVNQNPISRNEEIKKQVEKGERSRGREGGREGDLAELGLELGVNFVESATKCSELFASLIRD
jgi:hypothetical protein